MKESIILVILTFLLTVILSLLVLILISSETGDRHIKQHWRKNDMLFFLAFGCLIFSIIAMITVIITDAVDMIILSTILGVSLIASATTTTIRKIT